MSSDFTTLRRKVRLRIEDLCGWLEIGDRATQIEAYDAEQVSSQAGEAATLLREAVQEYSDEDHFGLAEQEVRSIRASLDELSVLGIDRFASPTKWAAQYRLSQIPSQLRANLTEIAQRIRKDEESAAARQRDKDELDRAIAAGAFIEFVRHNPGRGCWKTFPSYEVNVQYGDEYKQSWTECEIVAYRPDLWVIATTFRHVEADHIEPFTEYNLIEPPSAAANLLAMTTGLDVEEIIWLKKLAATQAEADADGKPEIAWNRELGELIVDGQVARRIARPKQAKNVTKILDVFQECGWPVRIDSPFPPDETGRTRLRETVSQLNTQLTEIRFEADGTGEGVRYRLVPKPQSPEPQPTADDSIPF